MADTASREVRFTEKDRVEAAEALSGVPAGTPGKVVEVSGLTWIRYRVRFDNGFELNLLDGHLLRPVPGRRKRH